MQGQHVGGFLNKLRSAVPLSRDMAPASPVETAPTVRSPTPKGGLLAALSGSGSGVFAVPSLLERIGGADTVKLVVEALVDLNMEDKRIARLFEGVSKPMLVKKLRMMLEGVLDPNHTVYTYSVQSMHRAHLHLKVTDADFDAFLENVDKALAAAKVDADEAGHVIAELHKFRDPVIGRGVWDE